METITEITLNIDKQDTHVRTIEALERMGDLSTPLEIDGRITFWDLNIDQSRQVAGMVRDGVYKVRSDDDQVLIARILEDAKDGFQEIEVIPGSEYKTFEEYYDHKKHDYLHGNSDKQRETKRVHETIYDIIHLVSHELKANNHTAITTMLLIYGAIQFEKMCPSAQFEAIRKYNSDNALSGLKHNSYFDGMICKQKLSKPAIVYANSRATILNISLINRVIHYYQDEFTFKKLEDLSIIGFVSKGNHATFGHEFLICLALSNCGIILNSEAKDEVYKLGEPTIECINELMEKENIFEKI